MTPSTAPANDPHFATVQPMLPGAVQPLVWRGAELGGQATPVISSGWPALDRELPGGGWPHRVLCEVLSPQPALIEWRLLGPALRAVAAGGGQIVVVAPPRQPYMPGLIHDGLDERRFVWIRAEGPAQRLWVTEQLIKANACQALVAWLPQARHEQLRRLQVCAQAAEGLVFLCRPEAAQHEASAAPLRVHATFALDWELRVRILKRRGPAFDGTLSLPSVPGGLASVLTPRLRRPARLLAGLPLSKEPAVVVGRPAVPQHRRHAASR